MTWEEFVESARVLAPGREEDFKSSTEQIEIGRRLPTILTRSGDVYATFWNEELRGEVEVGFPPEIWIAWGEYCKTLKAEMDRCSGAGVCSRPVKMEIKS